MILVDLFEHKSRKQMRDLCHWSDVLVAGEAQG
jgi:hypothetical protein